MIVQADCCCLWVGVLLHGLMMQEKLVGYKALVRVVLLPEETAIYLTSHRVKIWHEAVLWLGPRTKSIFMRDRLKKILDLVSIPFLGRHWL